MSRNPVTWYKVFLGISYEFLRETFGNVSFILNKPFPIPSASFPSYSSTIIFPFEAVYEFLSLSQQFE